MTDNNHDNYEPEPGEELEIYFDRPPYNKAWRLAFRDSSGDYVILYAGMRGLKWRECCTLPMRPLVRPEPPEEEKS